VLLADLVRTSGAIAATSARSRKSELMADALRAAEPDERALVVTYLAGELRQRRTGVGWATLRDAGAPAAVSNLTVADVDAGFERIASVSGKGSTSERRRLVGALMSRATSDEQRFLVGLVSGELRQGAQEGVAVEAVARAADVPVTEVRRAVMLRGALAPVAAAAMADGVAGLRRFGLQLGRPLYPMLAQTAESVPAALERLGTAAVDWKLDGVRVQVHRDGDHVAVFTRTLDDVTTRVPEVVEMVSALPVRSVVLDGEAIALRPDGRPRPFQETASRVASRTVVERMRATVPLTTMVFDVLHLDGTDLLAEPARERYAAADGALPRQLFVPRIVTADADAAQAFLDDALARGHEGVVVKSLDAPYEAGRRGAGWLKVKPVHTLDLVVLAAEWGHGRRKGWLSNIHLGARDPSDGSFVMLGKTFKGLTDDLLRWQTERFTEIAASPLDGWVVQLRPEIVVEVAFDGVQTSPRYPGGVALRFARVLRYRPDKRPEDADTIDAVRAFQAR
jgi:DNA ligase 1